jgi:hypothetical protein
MRSCRRDIIWPAIHLETVNETLSKYLAIGILLGLMAGFAAYVITNQILLIEVGLAFGAVIGAAVGYVLSKKK